jgi:hypothetical protein
MIVCSLLLRCLLLLSLDLCSCTSAASQGARSQHHSEIAVGAWLFQNSHALASQVLQSEARRRDMLRRTHSASKQKKDAPPDATLTDLASPLQAVISPASDDGGDAGLSRSASGVSRIGSMFKKVVSPPVQHASQTHLQEHAAETVATPTATTAAAGPKTLAIGKSVIFQGDIMGAELMIVEGCYSGTETFMTL